MNEQTIKLYKLAHVPHTDIDPSNNMPYETTIFSAEKFAELIIRECLDQVDEFGRLTKAFLEQGIDPEIDVTKEVLHNFGIE